MWQIVERFETPGLPVLLMIACLTLVLLLSIWYMKRAGLPIFMPAFANPRFIETWRSGHMRFPMLLRLGGARSCLWVVLRIAREQYCCQSPRQAEFAVWPR